MDAIQHFTQSSLKKSIPDLRAGDTVRVHQRIREGNKERIQIFEGVVLAVRGNKAINASFVVRRIASGVGVEKTFPLHSPNVVKVERTKSGKVRQARLFYLRERFGRASRLSGEVRNQEDWHEGKAGQGQALNDEIETSGEPFDSAQDRPAESMTNDKTEEATESDEPDTVVEEKDGTVDDSKPEVTPDDEPSESEESPTDDTDSEPEIKE
jgi:large subunit ribosomal protein L19